MIKTNQHLLLLTGAAQQSEVAVFSRICFFVGVFVNMITSE